MHPLSRFTYSFRLLFSLDSGFSLLVSAKKTNLTKTYNILKSFIKTKKNYLRGKHNILKDIMFVDKIKCILDQPMYFRTTKTTK